MTLKNELKSIAITQGAQLVATTGVEVFDDYLSEVKDRIEYTGAGPDDYMISSTASTPDSQDLSFFEHLSDARKSLATARTIIILGVYCFDKKAQYKKTRRDLRGKTARIYSYYPVVRQIAEQIVNFLEEHGHKAIHGQHVPLKYVADKIGLGAYGKNGIFQTSQYGSYIALRSILTEAEFPADAFDDNFSPCSGCEKCITACPTGAIYAPYKVNPKLCINPMNRRDHYIQPHKRAKMQNWISGCDICQDVCPTNRNLDLRQIDPRAGFDPRHHASHKNLGGMDRTPELLSLLSDSQPAVIRRNAAIALANTGKRRDDILMALKDQLQNLSPELEEYFLWAIENIEKNGNRQV